MYTVLIHISNEEPVIGEVEALPEATDTTVRVFHPRKKDGKDLPFVQPSVTEVIWPFHRITFIEVIPSDDDDEIFGTVRE